MRKIVAIFLSSCVLASPVTALAGQDVAFESLPAPVQATVKREVKGGQIVEIEYETKRGKPLYEVEFYDQGA